MKRLLRRPLIVLAIGLVAGSIWHWLWVFPFPLLSVWKARLSGLPESPPEPTPLPRGRWRPARLAHLTAAERARGLHELQTVGYLAGSRPAPREMGVTRHVRRLAQPGYNLVVSAHAPEASLTDMEGQVLHTWACDPVRAFGWTGEKAERRRGGQCWRRVRLEPDGSVFAIYDGTGLVKLDRESRVIWGRENGAHHDLDVADDGRILVLTREAKVIERIHQDRPSLEEFVEVLAPDGTALRKVSVLEALEASPWAPALMRMPEQGDILHVNTIEIIRRDAIDPSSPFRKGRLLISICYVSLVCVLDLDAGIVWAEGDRWHKQHQPTMLESGRVLLFDNQGFPGGSRVVEFDPMTMRTHWEYRGTEREPFGTPTCGSNQRLPNGNTLITESDPGRAFEVTPDGTIVWEYVSPHRAGEKDELVATLFEVVRLPMTEPPPWLDRTRTGDVDDR